VDGPEPAGEPESAPEPVGAVGETEEGESSAT
jgi:hypothetical protein